MQRNTRGFFRPCIGKLNEWIIQWEDLPMLGDKRLGYVRTWAEGHGVEVIYGNPDSNWIQVRCGSQKRMEEFAGHDLPVYPSDKTANQPNKKFNRPIFHSSTN